MSNQQPQTGLGSARYEHFTRSTTVVLSLYIALEMENTQLRTDIQELKAKLLQYETKQDEDYGYGSNDEGDAPRKRGRPSLKQAPLSSSSSASNQGK